MEKWGEHGWYLFSSENDVIDKWHDNVRVQLVKVNYFCDQCKDWDPHYTAT